MSMAWRAMEYLRGPHQPLQGATAPVAGAPHTARPRPPLHIPHGVGLHPRPGRHCSPRHPTHSGPSSLGFTGTLSRGATSARSYPVLVVTSRMTRQPSCRCERRCSHLNLGRRWPARAARAARAARVAPVRHEVRRLHIRTPRPHRPVRSSGGEARATGERAAVTASRGGWEPKRICLMLRRLCNALYSYETRCPVAEQ